MKFEKVDHKRFDGTKVIRYQAKGDDGTDLGLSLEATFQGVVMKGDLTFEQYEQLEPFAKAFTDAWKDHKGMLHKKSAALMQNDRGH